MTTPHDDLALLLRHDPAAGVDVDPDAAPARSVLLRATTSAEAREGAAVSAGRGWRRGPVLGIGAAAVIASVAATSPWWSDAARGCDVTSGTTVAEHAVADGNVELVALRADADGPATGSLLQHRRADGSTSVIGSCTPADAVAVTTPLDPVAGASLGGAMADREAGTLTTFDYGPVGPDVVQVELTWSDGEQVTVAVEDGWWLAVRELTDVPADDWESPHLTGLVLVDAGGQRTSADVPG